MKLLFLTLSSTDVYKNFEIEKQLLSLDDNYYVLRFWVNSPSVILGKFQKRKYEVNEEFVKAHNIPVLHRFSGGGTVYHDYGNLNISFCKSRKNKLNPGFGIKEKDFITTIIHDSINRDGIDINIDNRNAIFSEGNKLLGSAVAIANGRFLYHASLLVHADLDNLNKSINWYPNYPSKSGRFVKSKRDKVINLSQLYPVTMEEVKLNIFKNMKRVLNPSQTIHVSDESQLDYFIQT